ncbi:phospholipase [Seongchinamella unica]|uniref:Phospholipase n=1 Tax=Seongchinamella unica TaxID=2547392 RepID=A0A4R5LQK0_9GAMM|nr:phospholipase D-like domain-containing protein [Seongchinamella unica]TDG12799.1 phospholipase [Seongchinamella unica]
MKILSSLFLSIALSFALSSCSEKPQNQDCEQASVSREPCAPASAIDDSTMDQIYADRTWKPSQELDIDPIRMGEQAEVPIDRARAKLIGPTPEDGLTSLATKLWLIENAVQTIDVMYYIFARDTVGEAVLGALCNAVKRGVDVRIMVDSVGSFDPIHADLKALETCANEAGFMRNAQGQVTDRRARVQAVIFNAITRMQFNRRSHDKILIVDGRIPAKGAVMTGGRNISLDYYGINADGSPDPTAFRDLELLLRPYPDQDPRLPTVASVTEMYYTLLFLHEGNKRLDPGNRSTDEDSRTARRLQRCQESLDFLKNLPGIRQRMEDMPVFLGEGFRDAEVRLSHQLGNLTSKHVTTNVEENLVKNPNSILYLITKLTREAKRRGEDQGTLRVASPYLFSGKYRNKHGETVYDGAQSMLEYLQQHPTASFVIVTNSVMTSDNFFTQAIIDMEMAPRFLLTPELTKAWQSSREKGEFNPAVVGSEEWQQAIDHPQIFIYETGKLDSVLLGNGTAQYGKLHAKFILGETIGFIGTSNFDYRSDLWNNEMGFFFRSPELREDLLKVFNELQATSYRWGTPQWLQMRRELMESDSQKASPARNQRTIYKTLHGLGLEYLM